MLQAVTADGIEQLPAAFALSLPCLRRYVAGTGQDKRA